MSEEVTLTSSWWKVAEEILASAAQRSHEALLTETNSGYDPAEDAL